jgi:hypothetical protein
MDAFATEIGRSQIGQRLLGSDGLRAGRFLTSIDPLLCRAFRSVGFGVQRERDNPFLVGWRKEHPGERICLQRVDYLLRRGRRVAAIAELESLDRAQIYTFTCQYYDWDSGKREYYWATVDHLLRHRENLEFFLFLLALPDFPVAPYKIWDTSDEYYEVTKAQREEIFKSRYRFYDHRIKRILRDLLLNTDRESSPDDNWLVQGRPLAECQDVCELLVVTLTGPELILARGRDLLDPAREVRRVVGWTVT